MSGLAVVSRRVFLSARSARFAYSEIARIGRSALY